jgi:hypothetical protein
MSELPVSHRTTRVPGADSAERVPRWQRVRILIVELVPEAAKGAFALDGPCQSAPGP